MTLDDLIAYCAGKPGAEETYPWGEAELVCKVGGKAFAFIGLDEHTVGLKCGADWNTVALKGSVPDDDLLELVDSSYEAVVARLPKKKRP